MGYIGIIRDIEYIQGIRAVSVKENHSDEVYIDVSREDFNKMCFGLHQRLNSPVRMFFLTDNRIKNKVFTGTCVFLGAEYKKWFLVRIDIPQEDPSFKSLAKEIYSASLFEREIKEMFGVEPMGNPDLRGLKLHEEVCPQGFFPLRKDFVNDAENNSERQGYKFIQIEGDGVFEVPVGPVHAGIIGPGHFRFSVAGEPIINLEARLGFTHRGVEKLFEGKGLEEAVKISERISGDSVFAYSSAFCQAAEKICGITVPERALLLRAIFLELERIYNHIADIGGMAIDVGFSFPAMYAAVIKENLLSLCEKLSGSRYLKGINLVSGVSREIGRDGELLLLETLKVLEKDFQELRFMLFSSVSFMDRVDSTGILKKNTAEDLGVAGLAGRASGLSLDLRKVFPGIYSAVKFNIARQQEGDCLARLNTRFMEVGESINLIKQFLARIGSSQEKLRQQYAPKEGTGVGYTEAWRGPLLYWLELNQSGLIERCKIVDPSFHNWQGLTFAVLGNIIPDFPLCNKSFNLSYSGNDL